MDIYYYYFISILFNQFSIINGQIYLSKICFMTFDNATVTFDPSYPNASVLICPSSCYTMRYISNQEEYPIFGNETYSGNSLVCKSAMHDGRLAPWNGENSPVLIQNNSSKSSIFVSTLRNGILSAKSTSLSLNIYRFVNNRINETSIYDIAIEQRAFLYKKDEPSSITCRSKIDLNSIEPINIDHGWKNWVENRLKYFTFPWNMTRDQALTFCSNNNATLMYWFNSTEQDILQNTLRTTIHRLFRNQRDSTGNNTLTFYIGLKRINRIQFWESNITNPNDQSFEIKVNSVNNDDDYCTIIQSSGGNPQTFGIYSHKCDDRSIRGYPLCRLIPSVIDQQNDFIYRLETDSQSGNLTGVIDFCSELGGYPIYANNAYEWQLIQEIMLNDNNFNSDYAYTGLISQSKQINDAYWMPKNISYNSSLNYIWFASSRGADRIGFHLSKATDESYYALYDINPYTTLNRLRFCRKNDIRPLMKQSSSCNYKQCSSNCLNITLPSQTDNLRFGFYGCFPKNSLASIVYTQAFSSDGYFVRPTLPMEYSVALRRSFNESLIFNFVQIDKDLLYNCYEYLNFDKNSPSDDTIQLTCDRSNTNNKTISGIKLKKDFNGLLSIALQERRMSAHHTRFIDYSDSGSRCRYQGIYHPYINQCICSPGFYGNECQYSCPSGYYGQNCDFHCSGDDDYCKGLLICLPDPYGCSCYSGWYGTNCNISCPSNRYGPDCSYRCSCPSCNRFSGICNCIGTECYQGIYTRSEIDSRCSSSSPNLALLIAVPIVSVVVIVGIIGGLLYWRKKRSTDEEHLFENSTVRFSSDSYRPSIEQNQFQKDYNNILSERL
ncbi:unnamed protein product [Rotaria magnacalcarata]|uniref:EGF-like domain-containing protein n=3 Tax=Rotaria magnacalcarata TaxID=392030 RepID=A0A819LC36_9BILA|nr:unnamed protein product [Rotaria magnacalcarata]CAF2171232.1 unnamed protein product [Rotaria magnacalcarata]CAF3867767.1 unnamed protein product [Rotaria magnacalcarata]CAF3963607.1 unnamed protein product [Rotaria magnacalcarata]CAF4015736.1 unnamed protein product [Rotaria magnacalcarata]